MAAVHIVVLAVFCLTISYGREASVTYKVPAGARECFFEDIPREGEIDIEYQVLVLYCIVQETIRKPFIA